MGRVFRAVPAPFYLVGPTAVGKTGLAVEIALRCGAEIVSADAFQIYRGLDLLTAKPSPTDRRRVTHHLVDILPLSEEYSVARFLEDARRSLDEITARRKQALVVGGSGLYIRALTHGLSPLPPAQPDLRAELETSELESLVERLRILDPAAAASIDTRNKRRVVRAIEICELTGKPFSASRVLWDAPPPPQASHGFYFTRDRAELDQRINQRVNALVPNGVLGEVDACDGLPLSQTSSRIIGLAELLAYRRGESELSSCLAAIATATRQYAKRQMTWFRGKSSFASLNLSHEDHESVVEWAVSRMMAS